MSDKNVLAVLHLRLTPFYAGMGKDMKEGGNMRVLILSDSHGDAVGVEKIIASQPTAEVVLFCGDGEEEIESAKRHFPEKAFFAVCGNCDEDTRLPTEQSFYLGNTKVLLTHGHKYYVKSGDASLVRHAREISANIVVYGHTHSARAEYEDGLYLVNPGSCRGNFGHYAVLDLTKAGIVPILMERDKIKV